MAHLVLVIQIVHLLSCVTASSLALTGSSDVVKEFLQPLTLNCTFQANYTEAAQDFEPYFLYIFHDEQGVIATLSKCRPIAVNSDLNSIHVEGSLFDGYANSSYLLVTWKKPSFQQAGQYSCVAHARNSLGRDNIYTAKYQVKVETPNFSDWVKFVSEIEADLRKVKESLKQTRQDVIGINMTSQEHENKISTLSSVQKSTAPMIQEGEVNCGASSSYVIQNTGLPGAKDKEVPVLFLVPFPSPPTVILQLWMLDLDIQTRVYYNVRNVTNTGFIILCRTWASSVINNLVLHWHAIKK